jgi:ParB-like chromosome segregation protein Spo0J
MPAIQRVPIMYLLPAAYHPRMRLRTGMPALERLKRSIEEFGLVVPLVWNERTGHVVAGHQRLEVLRERGEKYVEAVVVSLSIEREQALNVALNNPQVGGAWDVGRLVEVLGGLMGSARCDATLTGFDEGELRDLLLRPA